MIEKTLRPLSVQRGINEHHFYSTLQTHYQELAAKPTAPACIKERLRNINNIVNTQSIHTYDTN